MPLGVSLDIGATFGTTLVSQPALPTLDPTTQWEKVALTRWGRYVSDLEQAAILEGHRLAGQPSLALEVGCEGGRWSKMLAGLGWKVVCTDVDPEALQVCQQRSPPTCCVLVKPDTTRLPVESGSVGLLLCVEAFPAIEGGWFPDEARRALAVGGLFVGVFLNRRSLRGAFVFVRDRLLPDHVHSYGQSYASWRTRLREQGFDLLQERGFCWFPFARASDSPLVSPFTFLERACGLHRLIRLSPWVVFIARKAQPGEPTPSLP